ncbi:glycosyltransferase family 39 protein [Kordia sp. YSTF-M3]|uniref:Glycosyltransferase family 39 protein n=1 Tax=Kordia aestuariivivens TaxID=2759037 RepID=A0ABR7QG93_9FLAO|nr:glycosyltransferase family 39 protein [Kordia aestuariivivens]MBC8757591.1 glycosyltransferase family 39 protein [Kordia aestuariivivens]
MFALRIVGFDGLYGQDSYEYLRYTNAIQEYMTTGVHPGNYFWPVLYPTLGSLLGFLFGSTAFALQFISCLSFSITCVFTLKTIRLLYPKVKFSFFYVLIFAVFCPFLLKMGLIVMSDALALVFVVLAFYFFFKSYIKNTSLAPIFIFATCALMTRYASLFITFPIIIYALYLVFNRRKIKQFSLAVILSLIVAIPFLIFQWGALFEASSNSFLKAWSFGNYFKSSFTTGDGASNFTSPNLMYTLYVFFHPGFIFIGFILSLITLKNYKLLDEFHQKILMICSGLYIFFLAGIPFQNPRVLGLVFPLILILLFPAFARLMHVKLIKRFFIPIGIVCVGLQLVFFSMTFHLIFSRTITEKEIATMIQPYQGATLYSFDVDLAMQGRGLDFEYKNMFMERYKKFNKNDLILFDPARYKVQWKDKTPMLNWGFIEQNYELKILETHSEGWKLYQVETKK